MFIRFWHDEGGMTRLSEEEKRYLKYQIYSFRYDNPWISNKKIATRVNRSIAAVNRYAEKAKEEQVISNPKLWLNFHFRKAALLLFEDKWKAFKELQEYDGVYYMSVFQGDWDILVIYDKSIDFSQVPGYKGQVIEGLRGKVFTQKVKYTSWEPCLAEMENLVEQNYCKESHLECEPYCPEWDEEDWKLFDYFRFNVRKPIKHLRKEYLISWGKYEEWKKNLNKHCTILMFYFPEGRYAYNSLTLCFRTAYEKFIVQLFSQLPATSVFYKIGDYLLMNIFVPWDYTYQMRIYDIISRLLVQKTITDYTDGNRIVHWYYDVGKSRIS